MTSSRPHPRRPPSRALRCVGAAALGLCAAAVGCSQDTPGLGAGPPPGPATTAEGLLSLQRLPRFDLSLDADARAALEVEPKEWVRGRFEYAGQVYESVGIRLKGNHSFRTLD
ncbi:MAG: hypothetical protein AB1Z98_26200, partial [Nannocystaceae bacterium]